MEETPQFGHPLVFWSSRKTVGPYQWPHVLVELACIQDTCGCRRKRLRDHDQQHTSRYVSYYETVQDPYERDLLDPRALILHDEPTAYVVKLYADMTTLTPDDQQMNRVTAQNLLTLEMAWLLRPCEVHGKVLTHNEKRAYGFVEPDHWKEIP